MIKSWIVVFLITAVGIGLYLGSLALVGFDDWRGVDILKWGGLGLSWPSNLPWLANIIVIFAFMTGLPGYKYPTAILGGVALIVGASAIITRGAIVTDESGVVRTIKTFGPGYWLWLASMAVCLLTLLAPRERSAENKGNDGPVQSP